MAKHLANTYGDRAVKVAKMAQLTGKRWPVVGRKLSEQFPYIEAEVQPSHNSSPTSRLRYLAHSNKISQWIDARKN